MRQLEQAPDLGLRGKSQHVHLFRVEQLDEINYPGILGVIGLNIRRNSRNLSLAESEITHQACIGGFTIQLYLYRDSPAFNWHVLQRLDDTLRGRCTGLQIAFEPDLTQGTFGLWSPAQGRCAAESLDEVITQAKPVGQR